MDEIWDGSVTRRGLLISKLPSTVGGFCCGGGSGGGGG